MAGVTLALTYAVVVGISDFMGGYAGRASTFRATSAVALGTQGVLIVLLLPWLGGAFTSDVLLWGAFVGVSDAVAGVALFGGIGRGRPAIVAPLSAIVSALMPLSIGLLRGSSLSRLEWFGVVLAIGAVLAVTRERSRGGDGFRFSLVAGAVAGIAISGIYIGMEATNEHGVVVLVPASALAAALLVSTLAIDDAPLPRGAGLGWSAATGAVMALGLVAFISATTFASLEVVAVVGSLYPAATVALAAIVWHHRPRPVQWAGLAMSVAALSLLAISA